MSSMHPSSRRSLSGRIARVTAAALLLLAFVSGARGQDRPNIVWISVEDMSPRLGAYGDEIARTPTIDRLAAEGVRFTRAFTTAGVCAPSRSAIITGMYQNGIGTQHMRTTHEAPGLPTPYHATPPPFVKAFTESLRAAGYFATNNAKTDYQIGTPFTVWDESGPEAHWRDPERAEDQPFFAVFNFMTTHESRGWVDADDTLTTDPATVAVPPYYPDTLPVRRQIARQYDNIARVDAQVADVLRQLEEDGYADDTVVFFWSDHGDGLPRAKRWLYDSGIHVPLIVRWPGQLPAGSVREDLVSFIDLGPTVLSIAGVPVPIHMDGRPFLGSQQGEPRRYVFAARDRMDETYDMVRAARDDRFKYIRNEYPDQPYVLHLPFRNRGGTMQELFRLHAEGALSGPPALWMSDRRPPEELYDTAADPHEIRNLAADPAYGDVLRRMRAATEAWMREIGDLGHVAEDQMVAAMWPGGVQPTTATPIIVERTSADVGLQATTALQAPVEVVLLCSTQGASIAYTTEEGPDAHWKLYAAPIRLEPGQTTLRAKAVRYGYRESDEARVTFSVAAN